MKKTTKIMLMVGVVTGFLYVTSVQNKTLRARVRETAARAAGKIIDIHNQTDKDVWVAIYYYKKSPSNVNRVATRFSTPKLIKAGQTKQLARPSLKARHDRELVFDYNQNALKDRFTYQPFKEIPHINIGYTKGSNFYLYIKDGRLKGATTFQRRIWQPVKQAVLPQTTEKVREKLRATLPAIKFNPYKNKSATVRVSSQLASEERTYLKKRKPKVKQGLEKLLGYSLDNKYVPSIAIVGSGGGYRAMLCTLGSLIGATKTGLLDGTTYMVGLSGSTWTLAGWLSGVEHDINAFKKRLLTKISKRGSSSLPGIVKGMTKTELGYIADVLKTKLAFQQPITLVDLYGAFLANALFSEYGDMRQRVFLSEQRSRIKNADLPFPIYTCVRAESGASSDWYEFTPYEVGSTFFKMFIPTWSYGRKFVNGKTVDFAPEQSLGFLMGTWGSAFAARFDQMYETAIPEIQDGMIKSGVNFAVNNLLYTLGRKRIKKAWAEVFNFTVGMPQSPLRERKVLKLVDGGAKPGFNLPYPAVSGELNRRKADMIILLDASAGSLTEELKLVENYAKNKRLLFPPINYDGVDKRSITIFKHETNPNVPVVVYMPRVNDPALLNELTKPGMQKYASLVKGFDIENCIKKDYCSTFNFEYDEREANQLSGLTEFNMVANIDKIKEALTWIINQKSAGLMP